MAYLDVANRGYHYDIWYYYVDQLGWFVIATEYRRVSISINGFLYYRFSHILFSFIFYIKNVRYQNGNKIF